MITVNAEIELVKLDKPWLDVSIEHLGTPRGDAAQITVRHLTHGTVTGILVENQDQAVGALRMLYYLNRV